MSATLVRSVPSPFDSRVRFLHQCFFRCPETCADENAIGAEHQCGGKTASVGNAPRSKEQGVGRTLCEKIRDFRHEAQRTAQCTVPAGFGSLRHDDLGTDIDRILHVLHILALTNHDRASSTDVVHEGSRVAEGQHHCCRTKFQRVRQEGWGFAQGPCYEADADVLVAGRIELILEPGRVPVSTANQA
jgi:hypothetical protein